VAEKLATDDSPAGAKNQVISPYLSREFAWLSKGSTLAQAGFARR
jgi:hypothetical protein